MNAITDACTIDWCRARSLTVASGRVTLSGSIQVHRVYIPEAIEPALDLCQYLLMPERDCGFAGAMLWLTEWELRDDPLSRKLIERLRASYGVAGWPIETPGHLFSDGELLDLQAFLLIPVLFEWDAYLLPSHGEYFIFVSHHRFAYVVSRQRERVQRLLETIAAVSRVEALADEDFWSRHFAASGNA